MTRIYRSFTEPDRKNLTWKETWEQEDKGLIKNYEVGRALAKTNPELAEKAKNGELPVLGYKGGVEKTLKKKHCHPKVFQFRQKTSGRPYKMV